MLLKVLASKKIVATRKKHHEKSMAPDPPFTIYEEVPVFLTRFQWRHGSIWISFSKLILFSAIITLPCVAHLAYVLLLFLRCCITMNKLTMSASYLCFCMCFFFSKHYIKHYILESLYSMWTLIFLIEFPSFTKKKKLITSTLILI